jgi:hypothetical protein
MRIGRSAGEVHRTSEHVCGGDLCPMAGPRTDRTSGVD